jgi:hypothetical protein
LTKETELTKADKTTLKKDIRISLIIGLLFFVTLIVILAIGPTLFLLFGKRPTDGFVTRGLLIFALLFIPFAFVSWKNILKYADIKIGKKLAIVTTHYEIDKTKSSVSLRLNDNDNRKIEVWEELLPLIDITKPLKIEIAILSKTIIFISHDHKNLLHE